MVREYEFQVLGIQFRNVSPNGLQNQVVQNLVPEQGISGKPYCARNIANARAVRIVMHQPFWLEVKP